MEQLSLAVPDKSCFLCLKEHTHCDGQRPCTRCKELKRAHVCFGSELQGKMTSNSAAAHKTQALSNPTNDARKRKRVKVKEDAQAPQIGQQAQPVVEGDGAALSQIQLNHYLVEELAKMRVEQLRMNQQLQTMQAINMELINQMRLLQDRFSTLQLHAPSANPSNQSAASAGVSSEEQAMVVFDLVRVPPIVLTANNKFCRLFGYTLEEVVGKPWQTFIQLEHLQRTFAQLQQAALSGSKLQLVQVYVDKLGRPFVAQDTHTFFVGQNNVALADFVTVVPLDTPRLSAPASSSASTATSNSSPFSASNNAHGSASSSPLTQTLIFAPSPSPSPIPQARIVHDASLIDSPQIGAASLAPHVSAFVPLPTYATAESVDGSPASDTDALMSDAGNDLDLDALSLDQMNLGNDEDEAQFARYFAS